MFSRNLRPVATTLFTLKFSNTSENGKSPFRRCPDIRFPPPTECGRPTVEFPASGPYVTAVIAIVSPAPCTS